MESKGAHPVERPLIYGTTFQSREEDGHARMCIILSALCYDVMDLCVGLGFRIKKSKQYTVFGFRPQEEKPLRRHRPR